MDKADSTMSPIERDATEPPTRRLPLSSRLFAPVDIASLVCFRVCFGVLMMVDVWRELPDIAYSYLAPEIHFSYYGFGWVRPWPGDGMYIHFAVLGLAALCVTIGLCYRVAALVFFVGISHVFLLEQGCYLNHMYLIALISFLMIFVPAHQAGSVDAWLRPQLRSQTAPAWALWLLRIQIGIPYFYGGLAKLNTDWLRGEPLRGWLVELEQLPLVGPVVSYETVVYFFSYGGLLFDLLVVPALLWRKTRPFAFAVALAFHLTNYFVFSIGMFPWVMMAATLIFFPPDWPRRLGNRARARLGLSMSPAPPLAAAPLRLARSQVVTLGLVATYVAWQLLFPLRHWLYPGDVAWTEEGHKFAWRMKLRSKNGSVDFYATNPDTGNTWRLDAKRRLTWWQLDEMCGRPEMILQFAHVLADELRKKGKPRIEIRAVARVSLNDRSRQLLIFPDVDLAAVQPSLLPARWIKREFSDF